MINHRELLKKYIAHVELHEGTTFLAEHHRIGGFTDEEWQELKAAEYEAYAEDPTKD